MQAEEVGKALQASFDFSPLHTQIVLAVLVGVVTLGGIRWVARAASVMVPVMIVFYMAAGLVILVLQAEWIPRALELVFKSAFQGDAVGGGVLDAQ